MKYYDIRVNYQKEAIWFSIAKAGKTSLEQLFCKQGFKNQFYFRKQDEIPKEIEHYIRFCVVRNPWDRFISLWFMIKRRYIHDKINPNMSLYQLLSVIENHNDIHWYRQVDVIMDDMDYIGYFERINIEINTLCDILDIQPNLQHLNKCHKPRTHYSHYYNRYLRDGIASYYRDDIERFGYTF